MTKQNRFSELWTDYLEGELDEPGVAELRDMLAEDEHLVRQAADLFQSHRLLGLVVAEQPERQDEFVRQTMALLPAAQDDFVDRVMSSVRRPAAPVAKGPIPRPAIASRAWVAAAVLLASVMLLAFWTQTPKQLATSGNGRSQGLAGAESVRFASSAHAKFFGELSPPVGSVLAAQREYILMSGLIELSFPAGASAILEGPAVFRVLSDESLALDVGRCSVHAPAGAEGFHVETPGMRVVDRGTRFSVSVAETAETEVQVIEGAADVYGAPEIGGASSEQPSEVRLKDGEARRFATSGEFAADAVPFDPSVYRRGLPDRVVSYEATTAADGGAENLISVSIQRGGRVVRYPVEDLIPARVVWFKAEAPAAFACGGTRLPPVRADMSANRSLVTGVINPGGSVRPLTRDPVMESESGTPGMAVRFDRPVVNGPGADVVLFDLQTFANPPDGDAFHVSPLAFRDGLRSHTVRKYDLTMESPEARDLTNFHVHFFKEAVDSVGRLESLECTPQQQVIQFRGLAVGIDLSDLGYAEGESVEGLFFQDALDDAHRVDPVFIGGLPETN
jgi:hypothetical protein